MNLKTSKILTAIIVFQLLLLVVVKIDLVFYRQVLGYIYLTFIPGILLILILNLYNKLDRVELVLYSVGLSLSTLIFLGSFINWFLPLCGIKQPLNLSYLLLVLSAFTCLCVAFLLYRSSSLYDIPFCQDNSRIKHPINLPLFLLLISLPIFSALGAIIVNLYNINYLLLFVLLTISILYILTSCDKVPPYLYEITVFSVAISLLYHRSLISSYLIGNDIQIEYYLYKMSYINQYWDVSIYTPINGMLSIVVLPVIYSRILNMEGAWIFKIIYPTIYALVPVGLYKLYTYVMNEKKAIISVFFFMSLMVFYGEMISLARQQVAEFFFTLILLILFNKNKDMNTKTLLIMFTFGFVVSHYGLSYIFLLFLALVVISNYFLIHYNLLKYDDLISRNYVILYVVFLFSWYLYIASSSNFDNIIHVFENIYLNFIADFFTVNSRDSLVLATTGRQMPLLHHITKILIILSYLFISIGLLSSLLRHYSMKIIDYFSFLSLVSYILLFSFIGIPHLSENMNISRIYHFLLFFLAPFCIIGLELLLYKISLFFSRYEFNINVNFYIAIFCALFLLFNSGFAYEVFDDSPTSISLDRTIDYQIYSEKEHVSALWLLNEKTSKDKIFLDIYSYSLFTSYTLDNILSSINKDVVLENGYIFLRSKNIETQKLTTVDLYGLDYADFGDYNISNYDEIYCNGGSEICKI